MAYVKVVKNKAYFKRYQVKYRRRREGKTDYRARKALILQDKNKYNAQKLRFVVRKTNCQIICQIASAHIEGDKILAEAKSKELIRYGIPVGLKNYAAAYATGLLCARRFLKSLNLDTQFLGVEKLTDDMNENNDDKEEDEERKPIKAFLDVGITRTTTGNRVFAALKGACDGGLNIPHGTNRFPGSKNEFNPEQLRKNILGIHVAEYMKTLQEEDMDKYKAHFNEYIKNKIDANNIEQMYLDAHEKIRKNPEKLQKSKDKVKKFVAKHEKPKKLNAKLRKMRVKEKLAKYVEKLQ
ncbi:60S ribosomal protein L5, putative [Plasmodium knowlesi strain H]|uniref:60S ribosomal protein L5, putative n=3 Tax=Plasmodium knowlesi TaxID=5850 RepID=A0A5K1V8J5_PLAKH|nr:60S ribosomal protein L5, putative [Plasmodium knowlesi strain H]OTN67619.1 putative 60S ribosomal protein L5 [Plasmodium knowlesi]CAA9990372.1 60S ribosomal protein L5, putative [Plasmodium knowlesi strain H]SBO19578.1 60S ribosomal protein L5, putative [Plasmodium knowlesi strain H]SBO22674.1 60S ribosomal protein L5, putative [Plasmodium knowlesi strain H]VVS79846.1 60S ribosomal protein L5, putative [Plasmodium knowlesi strain H]|eukprot:XP_002260772.1 Ribosomal protein family L5, putative [Plasmodium knowlesi strain H]